MRHRPAPCGRRHLTLAGLALTALATSAATLGCTAPGGAGGQSPAVAIVPAPVSLQVGGAGFAIDRSTRIVAPAGAPEAAGVAAYLAAVLRPATGYPLPVSEGDAAACRAGLCLSLRPDDRLGAEGYALDVAADGVRLRAPHPAGLFRGVQALRQLLPARIERSRPQPGPWAIPGVRIVDYPRFAWRGVSLDVARHFLPVSDVERFLDLAALYKVNILHLHLTDDQGWRLAIRSWPRLATYGGSTGVGGGPGGHYSQEEYAEIVRYARDHYVTVVPEIDLPGHTNAALASYPELTCDGRAPVLYTGIEVGFSALCVDSEPAARFLEQVIDEVAALTPGPYLHIGGDEAKSLGGQRYTGFVERAQDTVRAHGKRMVGWQEVARAALAPGSVAQYWDTKSDPSAVRAAVRQGAQLIMSPASHAYLDMKYRLTTRLGTSWAGYVEVRDAYDWDPASLLPGVGEAQVLGVEGALWTESVVSLSDAEYLTLPRLPGLAEIGWSPARGRGWDGYRTRLAAQGLRWSAMGATYYRSPQVPWPA
ncbi:MAG: beta-N-acetylhexosaminidase [Actinobacteria bacterium 13_2_20CM_2_71_6]|nr:MAG: beta-N-acetylhexosaminidase [Actinobacteria bacterium 13_2_20CM_2_71_6]